MAPQSPGCWGARVRKGPLPPPPPTAMEAALVWEEPGPGTMHKDREGASLVALGTEAWRWVGTWTQESAVGGDPMRAAPLCLPHPTLQQGGRASMSPSYRRGQGGLCPGQEG